MAFGPNSLFGQTLAGSFAVGAGASAAGTTIFISTNVPIPVAGQPLAVGQSSFAIKAPDAPGKFAAVVPPKLWLTPAGAGNQEAATITNSYNFFLTGEAVGRVEIGAGFLGLTSGVSVILHGGTMQPDVLRKMLAGHFGVSAERIGIRDLTVTDDALLPPGMHVLRDDGAVVHQQLAIDGTETYPGAGAPALVPVYFPPASKSTAGSPDSASRAVVLKGDAEAWAKVAQMPPLPENLIGSLRRLIEWLRWASFRWDDGDRWSRKRGNRALLGGKLPADFDEKRGEIIGHILTLITGPRRADSAWFPSVLADINGGTIAIPVVKKERPASQVSIPASSPRRSPQNGRVAGSNSVAAVAHPTVGEAERMRVNRREAKGRVTEFYRKVTPDRLRAWSGGRSRFAVASRYLCASGIIARVFGVDLGYVPGSYNLKIVYEQVGATGRYRVVSGKGSYVAAALKGLDEGGAADVDPRVLAAARAREEQRAASSEDPVRSPDEMKHLTVERITEQAGRRTKVKLVGRYADAGNSNDKIHGWRVADIDERYSKRFFQIPLERVDDRWVIMDDPAHGRIVRGGGGYRAVMDLKESGAVQISEALLGSFEGRSKVRSSYELKHLTAERITEQAGRRTKVKLVGRYVRVGDSYDKIHGWRVAGIDENFDHLCFQVPLRRVGERWVIMDDPKRGRIVKGVRGHRAVMDLKESGAVQISETLLRNSEARRRDVQKN